MDRREILTSLIAAAAGTALLANGLKGARAQRVNAGGASAAALSTPSPAAAPAGPPAPVPSTPMPAISTSCPSTCLG